MKLFPPNRVSLVTQTVAKTGGVVSVMVTVCAHVFELPQQSVADHVRVTAVAHFWRLFVNVLRIAMVTLSPQQASTAVGGSKTHGLLHSTVLSWAQASTGGVVSRVVTV